EACLLRFNFGCGRHGENRMPPAFALDDAECHRADALKLDFDLVAVPYRTDAGRRTGSDNVPGIERHHRSRHLDHAGNVEDEVAGVGVLLEFAVHPEAALEMSRGVADFIGGNDPRPNRAEAVETFSRDAFLFAADHRIDQARIAEHIITPFVARDIAALAADNDGKLAFVIDAPSRIEGEHDRIGGATQRRRRLEEEALIVGAITRAHLDAVLMIIDGIGDDLVGPGNGCEQLHFAERPALAPYRRFEPRTIAGKVCDQAKHGHRRPLARPAIDDVGHVEDGVVLDDADAIVVEAREFHGKSLLGLDALYFTAARHGSRARALEKRSPNQESAHESERRDAPWRNLGPARYIDHG